MYLFKCIFISLICQQLHSIGYKQNMFLILLIYHLIIVFFYFPGAYCRKYTFIIVNYFKMVT